MLLSSAISERAAECSTLLGIGGRYGTIAKVLERLGIPDGMTTALANLFGSSPVRPLEKHIDVACQCAEQLADLVAAVTDGSWDAAEAVRERINRLEEEADDVKQEIRKNLRRSLFMPVARDDLLKLLYLQDSIADRTRDVARILVGRKLAIPDPIAEQYQAFAASCVEAAKRARKAVQELDELYTVGFRGAEVDLVSGFIEEIERAERQSDEQQEALVTALFEIEKTLNPVDAVFLYDLINETWRISEAAEGVGESLEMLIAH